MDRESTLFEEGLQPAEEPHRVVDSVDQNYGKERHELRRVTAYSRCMRLSMSKKIGVALEIRIAPGGGNSYSIQGPGFRGGSDRPHEPSDCEPQHRCQCGLDLCDRQLLLSSPSAERPRPLVVWASVQGSRQPTFVLCWAKKKRLSVKARSAPGLSASAARAVMSARDFRLSLSAVRPVLRVARNHRHPPSASDHCRPQARLGDSRSTPLVNAHSDPAGPAGKGAESFR